MKISIGTLITLITAALVCGGFYYTTQMRLDNLEQEVTVLTKKLAQKNSSKKARKRGKQREAK